MFINKNANNKSAQYITSIQKKIARLLEKCIFKVVTTHNILSNAQIFNSRFVNKIKNLDINKTYKKSRLVVLAYNNQEKD